jgi:hypothetical protein
LAAGADRNTVTPGHEFGPRSAGGKSVEGHVAKLEFNEFDLLYVIGTRSASEASEFGAVLIGLQQCEKDARWR